MKFVSVVKPSLKIQRTNKLLADQGFTYNEAGKTYNEIGMQYAGIYGQDIIQITAKASTELPHNTTIGDFPNTLAVKTYRRGSPIGLLLDLTYSKTFTVYL